MQVNAAPGSAGAVRPTIPARVPGRGFDGEYPKRTGIRLVGCNMTLRNSWFNDTSTAESIVHMHSDGYGGQYEFTNFNQDSEGQSAPKVAAFLCENHFATHTKLRVIDASWVWFPRGR
jgi:hypothetical protein